MAMNIEPLEIVEFVTQVGEDGVIRVPEGMKSPQGQIEVQIKAFSPEDRIDLDWLVCLAEQAEVDDADLPADLALNHDHYICGTPKRDEGNPR